MDQEQPPQEAPVTNESIEDKLGSFDFDKALGPESKPEPKSEDETAIESLAGEERAAPEEKETEEEDPEVVLRDNTKVKLSELKKNYRPNYEQEAKVRAERDQAYAREVASFNASQQQMAQLLQQAAAVVQARMPQAPDPRMADEDPIEYLRQKTHYEQGLGELNKIRQAQYQHHQRAAYQQKQAQQQYLNQESQAALQAMPILRDKVKAAQFIEDTKALASQLGYRPDIVNQITDHRQLKLIEMALEGQRLKGSLEKAKAKLKEAQARPVEVQEPSRKRRTSSQVAGDEIRSKMSQLRKNPNSAKAAEAVLSDKRFDN